MPETATPGENFFTRKLGPLPVWAWALAAVLLLGGYAYWKKIGPFAGSGGDVSGDASSYPSVDPSSLASMIGAGAPITPSTVADGGPGDPGMPLGGGQDWHNFGEFTQGPAGRPSLGAPNVYGVNSSTWAAASEHQKELWKLHPGAAAGVR